MQFKKCFKDNILFIQENPIFAVLYATVLFIVTAAFVKKGTYFTAMAAINVSAADCFILALDGFPLYINSVILPCIFLSLITKKDFKINRVLRFVHLKVLWINHCICAFITALFNAILQILSTWLISLFISDMMINFEDNRSIFVFINRNKPNENISFARFFINVCIFCFLATMLFCLVYIFLRWRFRNKLCSIIVLLIIASADIFFKLGISTLSGVYYDKWINHSEATLLIPAGLIVLLFFGGYFLAERKEFLYAN